MKAVSEKIGWINDTVKPFEIGAEPKDESSIYTELDQAFSALPLNLSSFLNYFNEDAVGICHKFICGRTIDRLLVAVLNEEDNRIASFETKEQAILLLEKIILSCRAGKLRMRRGFFAIKKWNDDIEQIRGIVTDWNEDLQEKLIKLFLLCWRITDWGKDFILQNYTKTSEIIYHIVCEYGAIGIQSVVRGYLGRVHHRQELQRAKDENLKEIQKWSILILQKVARGYIARRTIVRSMKIRKQLSKDVLRIAEKFMKSGDVWGFLGDINEELERSKKELKDTEAREDNWASKFVEKVVKHRAEGFNEAWDRFPSAIQLFKNTNTVAGSLIDDHKDLSISSHLPTITHEHRLQTDKLSDSIGTIPNNNSTAKQISSGTNNISTKHATTKAGSGNSKNISQDEVVAAMNFTVDTHYSSNPNRMPGPLLRKALQTTVKVEVASQLNKIMQSTFHSRKLAQDIISVYGPESQVYKSKAKKGSTSSGPVKKQKTSLDGKVTKLVGKVSANGSDWLSSQEKHANQQNPSDSIVENNASRNSRALAVQPGNTLLLDVPMGLEDSIERLLHAAALRCYVPDFFRGATESLAQQQEAQYREVLSKQRRKRRFEKERKRLLNEGSMEEAHKLSLDNVEFDSDSEGKQNNNDVGNDEDEYDILGEAPTEEALEHQYSTKRRRRQDYLKEFPQAQNLDPNYAYRVYLSLPLGLAKIRYENECKKWAQPYVNQLRIKGLHALKDVLPVSKFMSCMVNVQTPRMLRNKVIDLCLDLKHMGSAAWGNHSAPSIPSSIDMSPSNGTDENLDNTSKSVGSRSRSRSPERKLPSSEELTVNNQAHAVTFQEDLNSVHSAALISATNTDVSFRANLDRIEDIDGTMQQLQQRNAILAMQAEEVARETQAQTQAKALLQSILENPDADWCHLNAAIDDFFIQAAFLIVPHVHHHPTTEKIPEADRNPHILTTVSEMSNAAFRAYAMELHTLLDPQDREDFVRARFRSAVILTTPFTLYLKNRGVLTVQDLLKVNLQDLQLPPALLYQLEVLITIVVGRQVHAKIIPTGTKAHTEDIVKQQKQKSSLKGQPSNSNRIKLEHTFSSSATNLSGAEFAVPQFYDTRFQRTPLDPFGRPPIITPNTRNKRARNKTDKMKLRQGDATQLKLSQSLTQFEKVTSQAALEHDMSLAPSLFEVSKHAEEEEINGGDSSIAENNAHINLGHEKESVIVGGASAAWGTAHNSIQHATKNNRNINNHTLVTGHSSLQLPAYVISVEEDGSSVASSVATQYPPQALGSSSSSPSMFNLSTNPSALKMELNSSRRLWHTGKIAEKDTAPVQTAKTNTATANNVTSEDLDHNDKKRVKPSTATTELHLPDIHSPIKQQQRESKSATNDQKQDKSRTMKNYLELNRAVRPVDCFKETFRCHYPGCNQVFSRNYTFKVHLKTHEVFPQYHQYKNNPQLMLDQLI